MRSIFVAVLSLPALIAIAAPAAAQTKQPVCAAFPVDQQSYACGCATGMPTATVWGSGPYTADSNICAAAVHAGVIGANGGDVIALRAEGQPSYTGSMANGISTRDWGSYGTSFVFGISVTECSVMPADVDILTCACAPGAGATASVWGAGPYTADSNLCGAAIHAGVIGADGGIITVLRAPGLPSYSASERNGIAARAWGSYPGSVVINANQ